eukprot:10201029-Alexandrium_andersonii.AAC.1
MACHNPRPHKLATARAWPARDHRSAQLPDREVDLDTKQLGSQISQVDASVRNPGEVEQSTSRGR